ncbi:galactose mutarotase-like protein [Wolfiporia cocos MD-104 SS10]|uniref:Galactose mutarotase-like protein n=1 Tax=Wolfiporia cocos (strain MD-104) TaxID=742152 RepID=A0A2H3JRN9_WOLCO|nr:galactose mutarotase-like protein [Wolfiporia cocos MD-104 SS10]
MASTLDPAFSPLLLTQASLNPCLALEVLPMGITLHRLFVQADGKTHDILIGPESPAGHLTQKYTNTIIGRYANRVPVPPAGTLPIARNGASAEIAPRANERPTVSLHGGLTGWDLTPWTPVLDTAVEADPAARVTLFTAAELARVQAAIPAGAYAFFVRESPDGEEGFPGRLRVEVLVALLDARGRADGARDGEWHLGSVLLVYRAKLLDGAVTAVNMTQHWGFNLDASLQEGVSVRDHSLTIKADHTLAYLPDANSAGALAPVAGTHHAHAEKTTRTIGERFPENGYDEFYVFAPRPDAPVLPPPRVSEAELGPEADLLAPALEARDPVVELAGAKSGLRVDFTTNQSGVQFYSNNFVDPKKTARKKIHGGSGEKGDGYEAGSAAFLEFHEPLAAWMHPDTLGPSRHDTLLAAGEVYNSFVRMDVWYRSQEGL